MLLVLQVLLVGVSGCPPQSILSDLSAPGYRCNVQSSSRSVWCGSIGTTTAWLPQPDGIAASAGLGHVIYNPLGSNFGAGDPPTASSNGQLAWMWQIVANQTYRAT